MGKDGLEKLANIKVGEIMIRDPFFTRPDEKISKTELLMLRKNVGGLPVVKENKLVGIITQRDIRLARFAMSLESPNTSVKDLMTPDPYTIAKENTLKEALSKMFKNKIERLPVVNEKNELVGLLLEKNVLKKLYDFI